jgi:hypothetical protein
MSARARLLGVLLGGVLATVVFVAAGLHAPPEPGGLGDAGPVLPDCEGAVRTIVIHYVPDARDIVRDAYRDLLCRLPADVVVRVVCPDRRDFADLRAFAGPVRCALQPVVAGHPMTCWSRDRWLALPPRDRSGRTLLLLPRGEVAAEAWPARAGDGRIGFDLASSCPKRLRAERSRLYFDGGDFAADAHSVFVAGSVLERNIQRTVEDPERFVREMSRVLSRKVVLLRNAPDHHVGMYMMPIGGRRVLVGDPRIARMLLSGRQQDAAAVRSMLAAAGGWDAGCETQRRFDAVAACCREAGYAVHRIPVVPAADGRTYLTYCNVLLDERDGTRTVYMPVYRGAGILNRAAAAAWRKEGYTVRRVDCTRVYRHGGSLRCLVNVLERGVGPA